MKNIIAFVTILILASCSDPEVPSHLLKENGNVYYQGDESSPFSGSSVTNLNGKLYLRTFYKNGLITKRNEYYPNGALKKEEFFEEEVVRTILLDQEGNDISNQPLITNWESGSVREKGKYQNGYKDGIWEKYSESGYLENREFWRKGIKLPIKSVLELSIMNRKPFILNTNTPYTGMIAVYKTGYNQENTTLQEFKHGKPDGVLLIVDSLGYVVEYSDCSVGEFFNFEEGKIDISIDYQTDCVYESYFPAKENVLPVLRSTYITESFAKDLDDIEKKSGKYFFRENYDNGVAKIQEEGFFELISENGDQITNEIISLIQNYKNGNPHTNVKGGKWVRFSEEGIDISNGEQVGQEISSYYPKKGIYKNGRKHGEWTSSNALSTYDTGILNGPYMYGWKDNCPTEEGSYKNGVKDGVWNIWKVEYGTGDDCYRSLEETKVYKDGSLQRSNIDE